MKIILSRIDDAFHFEAKNEQGNTVHIDADEKIGGRNCGVRPMQMLLMALAGCSAIDIVNILKKQRQKIDDFQIEVEGEREIPAVKGEASIFTVVKICFKIAGEVELEKAKHAAELSMEKYCSVGKTLRLAGARIMYEVFVNGQLAGK